MTTIHGGTPSRTTHARSLADHAHRRSPIAALVAGLVVCATPAAQAADEPALAELKATLERVQQENARINAENARLRQQLGGLAAPPAAPEAAAAPQESVTVNADAAAAGAPAATLQGVTVRSRNRLAALQDVPTSASAVSGDELQRLAATSMRDITARAANVTRQNSSNARSSDLAIRGIGRKGSSEAQDPNVGITVDGVSYGYAGLSAWDFVDIDTVEVLRGPVGTLGGKNSNVGGLYITTKKPSFTPGADFSLTFGQRDGLLATAAITGPVIDDLLAWRGTFYIDKVRGKYKNVYDNGDSTYTDRNKLSGKVQLLFTPTNTFSALLSADRQPRTFENDNGLNFFHSPPSTYSNGVSTVTNHKSENFPFGRLGRDWFTRLKSYDYSQFANYETGLQNNEEQRALLTGTQGASADLTWDLGGDYKLRSITAFRNIYFDARNDEGSPFDISTQGGGGVRYKQLSQEIRLNSPVGGVVDYQVGIYAIKNRHEVDSKTGWGHDAGAYFAKDSEYDALTQDDTGRRLLAESLDYARKLGTAVNKNFSPALYGQLNWHLSEPLTVTTGARITHEHREATNFASIGDPGYGVVLSDTTDAGAQAYYGVNYAQLNPAQKAALDAARALRKRQFGTLFATTSADTINKTQINFHVSPSIKFDDQVTGYVSFQHGEKAGVAQVINGIKLNAKPEKTNNIELGLKNNLFDRTLQLNADIFLSNIRDYQQQAYVVDPLNPLGAPIATTGNAAKVRAKGLEVDATYSGLRNTTLRFSGAYNDARYVSFTNSATPPEAENPGSQDLSGRTLPGAAKYTGNVGGEYRLPVFGNRVFHTDFNLAYTSRYNSDVTLSQYSWIKSYTITDLGIGLGRADRGWDVTLLVKNAFNTEGKSYGFISGTLDTTPRWLGVNFTSKL